MKTTFSSVHIVKHIISHFTLNDLRYITLKKVVHKYKTKSNVTDFKCSQISLVVY